MEKSQTYNNIFGQATEDISTFCWAANCLFNGNYLLPGEEDDHGSWSLSGLILSVLANRARGLHALELVNQIVSQADEKYFIKLRSIWLEGEAFLKAFSAKHSEIIHTEALAFVRQAYNLLVSADKEAAGLLLGKIPQVEMIYESDVFFNSWNLYIDLWWASRSFESQTEKPSWVTLFDEWIDELFVGHYHALFPLCQIWDNLIAREYYCDRDDAWWATAQHPDSGMYEFLKMIHELFAKPRN